MRRRDKLTSKDTRVPGGRSGHAIIQSRDVQSQISSNLGLRQNLLQDADFRIAQLSDTLRADVARWTAFPATENLEIGQCDTYIINCPNLHSLTGLILRRVLDRADQSNLIEVSSGFKSTQGEKVFKADKSSDE